MNQPAKASLAVVAVISVVGLLHYNLLPGDSNRGNSYKVGLRRLFYRFISLWHHRSFPRFPSSSRRVMFSLLLNIGLDPRRFIFP